jgi:copper chaperone CopZ
MTKTVTLTGMSCTHCAAAVTKALQDINAKDVAVDLKSGTATISADGAPSDDSIREAIDDAGYDVVSIS